MPPTIQPLIAKAFMSGNKAYEMVFNAYALYSLEEKLGCSMQSIGRINQKLMEDGTVQPVVEFGMRELLVMGWAGLEGARARNTPNAPALTLEEAANIIDGAGGLLQSATLITEAFMASFPQIEKPKSPTDASSTDPTAETTSPTGAVS